CSPRTARAVRRVSLLVPAKTPAGLLCWRYRLHFSHRPGERLWRHAPADRLSLAAVGARQDRMEAECADHRRTGRNLLCDCVPLSSAVVDRNYAERLPTARRRLVAQLFCPFSRRCPGMGDYRPPAAPVSCRRATALFHLVRV